MRPARLSPRPAAARLPAGLAALLAVVVAALVVVALGPLGGLTAPARAQTAPPGAALTLVSQTPFVGAGGEFVLRVRVAPGALSGPGQIVVTVYDPVATRSEFVFNIEDRIFGSPVPGGVRVVNLADATSDASGDVRIAIPLRNPDGEADASRLDLGRRDGVHPVRVALREIGGGTVTGFTTHLVYLPGAHDGPKLGVALMLPLHAPAAIRPDGTITAPDTSMAAAVALDGARDLRFTFVPTAETVAALAAGTAEQAKAALAALQRLATNHPVVAGPFVPLDLPAMVAAGLTSEVAAQLSTADETLSAALGAAADTHTWVGWDPLDDQSVRELAALGIDRMVIPEAALAPIDLNITLTRPVTLDAHGQELPAAMADAGLTAAFATTGMPVLAAHHLIADLTVLYLDEPRADRRGVVAAPPRDWQPTKAFLEVLVAGLAQNPVIAPITLDDLFADVLPAVTGRGAPLVRELAGASAPGPAAGGPSLVSAEVRSGRERLTSLSTILGGPTDLGRNLDQRLLAAEGREVTDGPTRQAYVRAVQGAISEHLANIRMPQTRSITVTARDADIPVTFQNRTGQPALVMVEMESDKLDFPDGLNREILLSRLNTTERFQVVSRTSGAFPLNIVLKSPDGNLVIGEIRVTVRSTAASGLSLAISVGAAGFLALWWARHIVRGRRARDLVNP